MSTAPPPPGAFHERLGDSLDVTVEAYNGRPQVRLRSLRTGGWFVVGVADLANLSGALDRALTAIVSAEVGR